MKEARKKAGLTVAEAAKRLRISRSYLYQVEAAGLRLLNPKLAGRAAALYRCTLNSLYGTGRG